MRYFDQTLNSRKTHISRPNGRAMGGFRELRGEKWPGDIGVHCMNNNDDIGILLLLLPLLHYSVTIFIIVYWYHSCSWPQELYTYLSFFLFIFLLYAYYNYESNDFTMSSRDGILIRGHHTLSSNPGGYWSINTWVQLYCSGKSNYSKTVCIYYGRNHNGDGLSQWEETLIRNVFSHWLIAHTWNDSYQNQQHIFLDCFNGTLLN